MKIQCTYSHGRALVQIYRVVPETTERITLLYLNCRTCSSLGKNKNVCRLFPKTEHKW